MHTEKSPMQFCQPSIGYIEAAREFLHLSGAGGRGTGKPGLVKSRVFQIGISDSEIGLYLISRQMSLH